MDTVDPIRTDMKKLETDVDKLKKKNKKVNRHGFGRKHSADLLNVDIEKDEIYSLLLLSYPMNASTYPDSPVHGTSGAGITCNMCVSKDPHRKQWEHQQHQKIN